MPDGRAPAPKKIEELFAWVVTEPDGGEGIPAVTLPGIGTTPMIGGDRARIESLRGYALDVAAHLKLPAYLKRFSSVETLETHLP